MAFMKEMAQQSIYMNPELLTKFFNLLIQKDSLIRLNPSSAIQHQLLQTYTQQGIYRMIQIFDDEYLAMLKSYNLLEALLYFLSKEAAHQIIKPNEPFVSNELLLQLLNQVFISATHTTRSAGKYAKFLLYIEENNRKNLMLQRTTDDENDVEFFSLSIKHTFGD